MTIAGQLGTLRYDGYNFGSFVTSKVEGKPEYDDAQRMIKFWVWRIKVSFYVNAGAGENTNDALDEIRRKLTVPGKRLQFNLRGFGDFDINHGRVKDVSNGPKILGLSWTPIGADQTALVEWEVEARTPECPNSKYARALSALTYSVDYDLDEHGFTSYTLAGSWEIALTFGNNYTLPDNADNYRDRLIPPVPLGYKRIRQNYKLSPDRRRMDFTVTDQQQAVPLPPGVTQAELKHRITSNARAGFNRWNCTISGSFRTSPEYPKSDAYKHFYLFVAGRLLKARADYPDVTILPKQIDIEENVFGHDTRASISYDMQTVGLDRILAVSGLWQPVGTTWEQFQRSHQGGAQHARGLSQLRYANADDTLLDLCSPQGQSNLYEPEISQSNLYEPGPPPGGNSRSNPYEPGNLPSVPPNDYLPPGVQRPPPGRPWPRNPYQPSPFVLAGRNLYGPGGTVNAYTSWQVYDAWLHYQEVHPYVFHQPLAGQVVDVPPQVNPLGAVAAVAGAVAAQAGAPMIGAQVQAAAAAGAEAAISPAAVPQRITAPACHVTLHVRAQRIGFRIEIPRLTRFGGRDVVRVEENVVNRVARFMAGFPVWEMIVMHRYRLLEPPTTQNVYLANPNFPINGAGN